MAGTNNFVAERKNSDVKSENSGIEELKSNSESDRQESEWIHKIRSEVKARSSQNAGGDVLIKKLPAYLRKPVEAYTPRQFQFGLHNRDTQASSSESEVLKISVAAAFKLNPDKWDKFCADVVDNPADMMLKSYGIYSSVTELSPKEVQYLLTLDALTLVLVLCVFSRAPDQAQVCWLPHFFIRSLAAGGFNIAAWTKAGAAYAPILDDLFLFENQIPMALMKKAISKCYGLLPEERKSKERKSNNFPDLRELENPDSNMTKTLLDQILKIVAKIMCTRLFAKPCPYEKKSLLELIDVNYEVGKLENCAHIFACIHNVMTSYLKSTIAEEKSLESRTKVFAPDVNQQLETDVEATTNKKSSGTDTEIFAPDVNQQLEIHGVAPPIAVTRKFGRAKQWISTASFETMKPATDLKKAGLQIRGIPGMVKQVAFKNGCLSLPIMTQSDNMESCICNMAAYELMTFTSGPYPFMDYLLLMTQLIKSPEDVSYLVECDVIRTYLGTHQRIFQMWERLQSVICYPPYSDEYKDNIVKPINRHCVSALNVMRTDFYNTCSKPWLKISVILAIILLVATLIQTYVLVIGSDKMQPHFPRGG